MNVPFNLVWIIYSIVSNLKTRNIRLGELRQILLERTIQQKKIDNRIQQSKVTSFQDLWKLIYNWNTSFYFLKPQHKKCINIQYNSSKHPMIERRTNVKWNTQNTQINHKRNQDQHDFWKTHLLRSTCEKLTTEIPSKRNLRSLKEKWKLSLVQTEVWINIPKTIGCSPLKRIL